MKTVIVSAAVLSALVSLTSACTPSDPTETSSSPIWPEPQEEAPGSAEQGLSAHGSAPASAHVFPRESTPFGHTYEEWAARWWQWALPIPVSENPVLGGSCDLDQSGSVYFLAGTSGGPATRSCTVPAGKALFLPFLNAHIAQCPELTGGSYTCEAAMSVQDLEDTASWIEGLEVDLILEIDGVAVDGLEEFQVRSEPYTSLAPEAVQDRLCTCSGLIQENPCGVPVGSPRAGVSAGYWALLRPLPVGPHTLRFGGTFYFDDGTFSTDVTFDLVVAP